MCSLSSFHCVLTIGCRRGRYALAPRSLSELQPYLRANFQEDIIECTICHEVSRYVHCSSNKQLTNDWMKMITVGIGCSGDKCQQRMHQNCFVAYGKRKERPTCSVCEAPWPKNLDNGYGNLRPVGEDAAQEGDDFKQGRRRQTSDDDEDEGDEGFDEDMEESQQIPTQPSQRRKSSRKGKEKAQQVEEDEDEDE